jgi:pSer/pThr/pTyr-binding forkhead associated (FHA) protein
MTSTIDMFTLTVRQRDNESATLQFDEMKITIGRSSRNGVCISDPFASRFHAEIKHEGAQVLLIDAGSANGTFLNGQRVTAAIPLRPGDLIRIGQTEIEYSSGEQDILSLP